MTEVKEIDGKIHYIVDKEDHYFMKQFLNSQALKTHKKQPYHNNALFNSFWRTIQESEI